MGRRRNIRKIFAGIALCFILFLFWYLPMLKFRCDSHYDISRYSPTWMFVMTNDTFNDFPVIDPVGEPQYGYLGYNHTNYGMVEWNLEYVSKHDPSDLLDVIWKYMRKEGYQLKESSGGIGCNGASFENTLYYSAVDSPECITIALSPETETTTRVRFFLID